jgi:hypothetical protein
MPRYIFPFPAKIVVAIVLTIVIEVGFHQFGRSREPRLKDDPVFDIAKHAVQRQLESRGFASVEFVPNLPSYGSWVSQDRYDDAYDVTSIVKIPDRDGSVTGVTWSARVVRGGTGDYEVRDVAINIEVKQEIVPGTQAESSVPKQTKVSSGRQEEQLPSQQSEIPAPPPRPSYYPSVPQTKPPVRPTTGIYPDPALDKYLPFDRYGDPRPIPTPTPANSTLRDLQKEMSPSRSAP